MAPSTRARVASNTAVQVAGKAVVLALGAVSIVVLTRYLGPDDYGRYTLALMYMQLFGVLADVGLYTTVVRDISRDRSRTEELVGNAMVLRLVLAVVMIALGVGISLLLPYDPDVRVAIALAGVPLLVGMLTTSLNAVFQSELRMGRAAVADVTGRAVALGLVALVAGLDLGFYAVMGAAAGGGLATLALTIVLTRGLVRVRPLADTRVWRALLRAGLPLGIALAINQVYFRADTLIISLYEPYEQVGIYTLAYRILELTLVVGTIFLNTTFPIISEAIDRDPARVRRALQDSTEVFAIVGAPVVAGGLILAPDVIEVAGGGEFAGAATPLQILLFAGAIATTNGVFGFALIAKRKQASALWLNLSGLAFNVGLNFALVPRYGIEAAAWVTVASEILILLGSVWLMHRHFGYFTAPRTLPAAALAAGVMAGLLWALPHLPLPASLPLAVLVYGGILFAISPASRAVARVVRS